MKQKTLVQELQYKALRDGHSSLEVLRLALYVSRKLKLPDFENWVNLELNGYGDADEIPPYRHISCRLKGLHPIRGGWQQIDFSNPKQPELFSKTPIHQPLGELERISATSGMLKVPLSIYQQNQIKERLQGGIPPTEITRHVDSGQVMGIVDKVKSLILKWSLDLEEVGIMGEEMGFSDQEKESAKTIIYNNYIHSMDHSQIQQGNKRTVQTLVHRAFDSNAICQLTDEIKKAMASLDLTANQKSEIEADLNTLNAQTKSPNPKVTIIEGVLCSLRNIFEKCTGNVASALVLKITGLN